MMRNPELAQAVMQALADLGVQLAVDDYGTGYSSLEYLLKLPINEIKLDRAFCADIVTELRATAIVRSTVDLTHALGLRMVAEGVEDEGTLFVLRELGCDLVQGWHLGRPMPAPAFEMLIAQELRRGSRELLGEAQPSRWRHQAGDVGHRPGEGRRGRGVQVAGRPVLDGAGLVQGRPGSGSRRPTSCAGGARSDGTQRP